MNRLHRLNATLISRFVFDLLQVDSHLCNASDTATSYARFSSRIVGNVGETLGGMTSSWNVNASHELWGPDFRPS